MTLRGLREAHNVSNLEAGDEGRWTGGIGHQLGGRNGTSGG